MAVSGLTLAWTATVAAEGRNDLGVNPKPPKPAKDIASLKICDIVPTRIALYGGLNEINNGSS